MEIDKKQRSLRGLTTAFLALLTAIRPFCSGARFGRRPNSCCKSVVVTIGFLDCRVWADCCEPLMEFAGNKLKSAETRCAAVDSFAIACFVAESDPLATLEAMSRLCSMWSAGNDYNSSICASMFVKRLLLRLYPTQLNVAEFWKACCV